MTTLSPEFKKNLESAILEHGRFACPNIECTDWITSKEIIKQDGSKFLEYYCTNNTCCHHSKTIIPIEEEVARLEFIPNPSKQIKNLLVGAVCILLILTVAFGGYFPNKAVDNSSSNISQKEVIQPVVKKRKIVLSTPVFREDVKKD